MVRVRTARMGLLLFLKLGATKIYHFLEVRTESKAVWTQEKFGYFDVLEETSNHGWQMEML